MFSKIFRAIFGKPRISAEQPHESFKPNVADEVQEAGFFSRKQIYSSEYPDGWGHIRRKAIDRDSGHCQVAGCLNYHKSSEDQFGDLKMHVHHKRARSDGGSDDLDNLVTLCAFHHGLLHFKNQLLKEKIKSARFCLVRPYWKRRRWSSDRFFVGATVRRFQLARKEELRSVREYFGLVCGRCESANWQGDYFPVRRGFKKHWLFETRCSSCGDRWLFDHGLLEETGFQIASRFSVTRNQGSFTFDPNLIVGLDAPEYFEGCPQCPHEGRIGYLVRKDGKCGPFLSCSEWQRGKGCNYKRNIRK